ncbi:MAG: DUF5996 family protein [Bacteroidales bacterium]
MDKIFLTFGEWKETAETLRLYLQMAGKVKLERCYPRPEWSHIRMYLTIDGLSTGIIPGDASPFSIHYNLRSHQVEFVSGGGSEVIKLVDELSVQEFYRLFMDALKKIGSPTAIDTMPQEIAGAIDFTKDDVHYTYNPKAATQWLENMLFAYQGLLRFLAPFRGKVNTPAYYFGAMDLSCTVFSGESRPYPKENAVISKYAFDEALFECGFWPGDPHDQIPSFFALPYPFISSISPYETDIWPKTAVFDSSKNEFFLNLKDVFNYPDPFNAVMEFCNSTFKISQLIHPWDNIDWITRPLGYPHL